MAETAVTISRASAAGPSGELRAAPQSDIKNVARWLSAGGDGRLHLRADNQLNDYGCRPYPRPEALSFASSTASSISQRAFGAVANAVQRLSQADQFGALKSFVETQRAQLKALWGVSEETDIVFAPSGTDAVLRALYLAKCVLKPPVISIVVGADESGSGVPFAAAGCHFNSETAYGFQVVKGEPIHGLANSLGVRLIATRGAAGRPRPTQMVDAAVYETAKAAIADGNSIVLHLMDHSKLGIRAPSPECVLRVMDHWAGRVQIIVDACQARVSRANIQSEIAQSRIVLLTGSKFFTGPPFSGAVFVPATLAERAAASAGAPLGFLQYTCASDWPARFTRLRGLLPPIVNLGQALRWAAAIEEMQAYFSVPGDFRKLVIGEFAKFATEYIGNQPNLRLFQEACSQADGGDEFCVPTIFPFLPVRKGRPCSMNEANLLHRALNEDVSEAVFARSASECRLLAQICHIGQPVAIPQATSRDAGSLRVSADARLVSQSWFGGDTASATPRLRANIDKLKIVFDKLQVLLAHMDELQSA
jgi:selenocysteine lyase/cysteine desulfurase